MNEGAASGAIRPQGAGGPGSTELVIGTALDDAPWGGFQKRVLLLAAIAVVFDGLDNQLIGFAAPALIRDWGIDKADLVPIIAASLIAMTIGTAIAGFVADRIGRRPTLIASVALFGIASAAIALAPNLIVLFALRLIAALGLGGAMPTATALVAEFTPKRNRSLAVTLGIVCVPLGGLLGGVLAATILPSLGWRALFLIGGILPLIAALIFAVTLPESPQMLHARGDMTRLRALLRRSGIVVADEVALVADSAEQPQDGRRSGGLRALFAPGYARDTVMIWAAFFTCLLAVYSVFNWAPTYLADRGLDLRAASTGLAAFNFGGIAGAIICGWAIDRFGSRWPLSALSAVAVLVGLGVVLRPLHADVSGEAIVLLFGVLGFAINGVQTTLFALAASLYPADRRATGVGMALGVGRFGAVLSSAAGATAIAMGGSSYFALIAIAMAGAFISVMLLRRHTPPARSLRG